MKGGRTAPRNYLGKPRRHIAQVVFNEGGADCPPKPSSTSSFSLQLDVFNEGGADCPPKRRVCL